MYWLIEEDVSRNARPVNPRADTVPIRCISSGSISIPTCDQDLRQRIEEVLEEFKRFRDDSPSLPEE